MFTLRYYPIPHKILLHYLLALKGATPMKRRNVKRVVLMILDFFIIISASTFTYLFLSPFIHNGFLSLIVLTLISCAVYLLLAIKLRMFDRINRFTGFRETMDHVKVITVAFLLSMILFSLIYRQLSLRFFFLAYLISVIGITESRIVWRLLVERQFQKSNKNRNQPDPASKRTLVVGAGKGGSLFMENQKYNNELAVVGLIDDDPNKYQMTLFGIPVLGTTMEMEQIVKLKKIDQITIAIPSLSPKELARIVSIATKTHAEVNQMPSLEDVLSGKHEISTIKEIDVVDLLGREEVKLDIERIASHLTGKTVLISGAGGSIGSEICRQIIRFSPKRIILLGHGEHSIYLIHRELLSLQNRDFEVIPVIADIQDRKRIFEIFKRYKPQRVFHAAAHKHVPLMEYNPSEAVKNNIFGTKNMAEAAKETGVKSFVMISTDKAVNPPNVMGATKRIAEMIVTGLNEKGKTNFVAVRFGNVLNSRGSVIPVFHEQIKNREPLTITDFRMTRYFMTIPEASRLALQADSLAKGGEIFLLDMGAPVKIVDLARKMIRLSGYTEAEIPVMETGIRPGEKLFEELLTTEENTEKQVFEKIFVGKVRNRPLISVLHFIEQLQALDDEEIKEKLLAFANKPIETSAQLEMEHEEQFAQAVTMPAYVK